MTTRKKVVRISNNFKLSKELDSELSREAETKKKFKIDIVEEALKEYFHPFDKVNHEKYSKMQLARLQKEIIAVNNKLDITLIMFEEFMKTFYRNIPELSIEDKHAKLAIEARVHDGTESFVRRVIASAINNKPNILSALNISKPEEE